MWSRFWRKSKRTQLTARMFKVRPPDFELPDQLHRQPHGCGTVARLGAA